MEYFGTNLTEYGHYRWSLENDRMTNLGISFRDLPFHPEDLTNNLPKGEVIFYQGGGYTVVGISGSCKDGRPGTKSIFWIKEIISKSEMVQKIMQNPSSLKIINAIPFEILWNI
jgi:hypothetical protein